MLWSEGCDVIHCGFWVNWSKGSVNGATLTLPSEWALIMSGFLALFVKLVGGYLWEALCFCIHQFKASLDSQDDIHHQMQLILRNTESESTFVWKLFKVGWAHRGFRLRAFGQSWFLVLLALIHGLGIWAAGGLSSRFIAGSDQVQMLATTCGWMKEPPLNNLTAEEFDTANALIIMGRYRYRKSASYARSCYGVSSANSAGCGTFHQTELSYSVDKNAPCPFGEKICNGAAISLDTGFVRSDEHLGINTRAKDSISMRKTLVCVPLNGELYTNGWQKQSSFDKPGLNVTSDYKMYNFTQGNKPTFGLSQAWYQLGDQPYSLDWVTASLNYQGDQSQPFDPIPELASTDADNMVISLTNRIIYPTAVTDPWFDAKNCTSDELFIVGNGVKSCVATNPMSFLGCQERYQFCTYGEINCTPFTGLYGITAAPSGSPDLTPTQKAVFQLYWKIAWATQLEFQLGFIGREALSALDYLWDAGFGFDISATLPPDHWHREVTNWMNTTLSLTQLSTLTFARAPEFDVGPGLSTLKYVVAPNTTQEELLCHKMVARSGRHTSFSVLGLFTLLSIGILLIILNIMLPKVVANIQHRMNIGVHKRLEWIESSAFQMQRMAAEGRGIGPWEGRDKDVPILWGGKSFSLTKGSLETWRGAGGYGVVRQREESGEKKGGELENII